MPAGIVGIDHPVIGVRDLDAGKRALERLGFVVPPRGRHLEWGTGNRCAMLQTDYIELRGVIDAGKPTHDLLPFLEKREGLMGVAFATRGCEISYREAKESGLNPKEPTELTRAFELPEGVVHPRFRLVFFDEKETPGLMRALVCQHLTPAMLRRPEWLDHPNGAVRIVSMTSVVPDPARLRGAHEKLFGKDKVRLADGRLTIDVGGGARIEMVTPAEAEAGGDAIAGVEPPYLSAFTVGTRDLEQAAKVLERNGVRYTRDERRLRAGPEEVCGAILRFCQATD